MPNYFPTNDQPQITNSNIGGIREATVDVHLVGYNLEQTHVTKRSLQSGLNDIERIQLNALG